VAGWPTPSASLGASSFARGWRRVGESVPSPEDSGFFSIPTQPLKRWAIIFRPPRGLGLR
jgi:hypothetical protein